MGVDNGVFPIDQMLVTVTKPLEDALNQVQGLDQIWSRTSRGTAEIDLFFKWNVDMYRTLELVNAAVARVQTSLPPTAKITANRLTFAALPGRQYLSGVNVKLADASGKTLLDTVSDGPLFYAAVPPGHYRLTVTSSGQAQTGEFSVAGNGVVSRAFFWRRAD